MPPATVRLVDDTTIEAVLPELRDAEQWVCWRTESRDGKPTKVPLDPGTCGYASVADESTWRTFETAQAVADTRTDVDGLGFVFTAEDDYIGIDIDDCLELAVPGPGVVPDHRGRTVLDTLPSYTEVSPSGTGLHVIVRGTLPEAGARADGIELYQQRRFFTMTGRHLRGTPTQATRCDEAVAALYDEHFGGVSEPQPDPEETEDTTGCEVMQKTADERTVLALARNASNGAKFERLWNGSTAEYQSHSEADMALCTLLAFWTGGDRQQMDSLFRQSGLMRPKWDAQRGSDTYGERTITRALEYVDDYYDHSNVQSTIPNARDGT